MSWRAFAIEDCSVVALPSVHDESMHVLMNVRDQCPAPCSFYRQYGPLGPMPAASRRAPCFSWRRVEELSRRVPSILPEPHGAGCETRSQNCPRFILCFAPVSSVVADDEKEVTRFL